MKKYIATRKSVCEGRLLKIDSMLVKMLKDNEYSKEQTLIFQVIEELFVEVFYSM